GKSDLANGTKKTGGSMKRLLLCQALMVNLLLVAACSRDPEQLVASGKKYLAEGKYKEAALEFRAAINAVPGLATAHFELGLTYIAMGQPGNAYQELERAASLDPSDIEAQLKYGNLALISRKFDAARSAAGAVLKRDSKSVRAHILRGNSYAGMIQL